MAIKIAPISSFSTKSISETAAFVLQNEFKYIDLYTFMQDEAELIFSDCKLDFKADQPKNVLAILSASCQKCEKDPDFADTIAKKIDSLLAGLKVIGFSTFLPEIGSQEGHVYSWESAINALMFLIKVAGGLKRLNHPIRTIELVSGSSGDGVWKGTLRDPNAGVATVAGQHRTMCIVGPTSSATLLT